jgi:hypothetical protein
MTPQAAPASAYIATHDAIIYAVATYLEGIVEGNSSITRLAFHPAVTFFGYYPGGVMEGSADSLFEWIDKNGPAPDIQARYAGVEIIGKIALVRLKLEGLSGSLAGTNVSMSDVFTLMQTDSGWKIVPKAFHWHL